MVYWILGNTFIRHEVYTLSRRWCACQANERVSVSGSSAAQAAPRWDAQVATWL